MIDGGDPRGEYAHACAHPDAGCGQATMDARAAEVKARASHPTGALPVVALAVAIVLAAVLALARGWLSRRRP